jgi:RND superfamily putative drug exporter
MVLGLASVAGGRTHDDWDVPGARAQAGIDLLRQHVPGAGNASAEVVVHDDSGPSTGPP